MITSDARIFRRARFLNARVNIPVYVASVMCLVFLYDDELFCFGVVLILLLSPSHYNCYYYR
jgi:hypothetical protein